MGIVRVQAATAGDLAEAIELSLPSNPLDNALMILAVATSGGVDVSSVVQTGATWALLSKQSGPLTEAHLFGTDVVTGADNKVTVTLASLTNVAAVLCEYAGMIQSTDKTATNSGTGSPARSGATVTTSTARELWVAALTARHGDVVFSNPRDGFAIVGQVSGVAAQDGQRAALLDRIVDATGVAEAIADIVGTSLEFSGAVATIRAADQTPQDPAGPLTPQPAVPEAIAKQSNHVGDGLRNLVQQFRSLT